MSHRFTTHTTRHHDQDHTAACIIHSHPNDYRAVIIQGKMAHWVTQGGSEKSAKQLGVGDLAHMPGKIEHISKCLPGEDCLVIVIQRGKFDFVSGAAKP